MTRGRTKPGGAKFSRNCGRVNAGFNGLGGRVSQAWVGPIPKFRGLGHARGSILCGSRGPIALPVRLSPGELRPLFPGELP